MPIGYRVEKWREMRSPNAAMLRHLLAGDGYEVFQWADPPGRFYGSHAHDDDQSHWIVSGELELTFDTGRVCLLGPGDRDFIPAGTFHAARVVGDEMCIYLVGSKPPEKKRKKRGRPSAKREVAKVLDDLERRGLK